MSELTDELVDAIKSVGQLNNFTQTSIEIFDTGAVYLFDGKTLISRWGSLDKFLANNHIEGNTDD